MLVVVAVESSTIASVGYDLTQGLLQLEFCSGALGEHPKPAIDDHLKTGQR
jgi:hypothetical protein